MDMASWGSSRRSFGTRDSGGIRAAARTCAEARVWLRLAALSGKMCEGFRMERDVVCGMQVDPSKAAARSDYNGRTYFFCCGGCKTKFDASPERYLANPAQLADLHAAPAVLIPKSTG